MTAQNFPFAFPLTFDAEKLKELFGAAKLPGIDADGKIKGRGPDNATDSK